MKRYVCGLLCALLLVGALPFAVQAAESVSIGTGSFSVDGSVAPGEYGEPVVSLAGEGKEYWKQYYVKQNGAAASGMNEAILPDALRIFAGYDENCLYLAVEVETDACYTTIDAPWNHFTHFRLFFDPADTKNRWDAVTIRPTGDTYDYASGLMQHFETRMDGGYEKGVLTFEAAYKWEKILSAYKTDGAPAVGDTVQLQVLFAPAADKSTVYYGYLNPAGSTADEQEKGTGNVYPAANWLTLSLSDRKIEGGTPETPETEPPADLPAPAEAIPVYTGTFRIDGEAAAGEYGPPIAELSGVGREFWRAYYIKQNGAAASGMNEAILPDALRIFAGYDENCLYLAVEVETDACYTTIDAPWNHFTHFRLFFDPADTKNRWDVVTVRPTGETYDYASGIMQHFETRMDGGYEKGVLTFEAAYRWEKILSSYKDIGAPIDGDTVQLQVLFAPAADKSTVYYGYLNPAGSTADEQEMGTGNVYPAESWLTLEMCDGEKPVWEPPVKEEPAETEMPAETTAAPETTEVPETEKPAETTKATETEKPAETTKATETEKPAETTEKPETKKPVETTAASTETAGTDPAPQETDAAPAGKAGSVPVGAIAAILAGVTLVIGIVTSRARRKK